MLRGLCEGFLELLYPRRCLICKARLLNQASVDNLVCAACWSRVKKNPPPFCHCCGRHLDVRRSVKNLCWGCFRRTFAFDRAFCPCLYEGVLKELIHQFKYGQKDYLGKLLTRHMIDFIKEYRMPIEYVDMVVPIPLAAGRLRDREFNQARILARCLAEEFDVRLIDNALVRSRMTQSQTELSQDKRLTNIQGSFAVKNAQAIKGRNLLVVDDVLTTGATVSEAAAVLKKAGAGIVFVMTLAN
jgi:ComF family protein